MADPGPARSPGLAGLGDAPIPSRDYGYEQVYRLLRRSLLTQRIPPGTRLVELQVAARLGVSRTPVREALRRLESDGFVVRGRTGGLESTHVEPDEVEDIFRIRAELDRLAAGLASERGKAEDWERARASVAAMGRALDTEGSGSDAFSETHLAVHAAIYDCAFRPRLAGILNNSVLHYLAIAADLSYGAPAQTLPAVEQHTSLVEAIASGDPLRAAAAADAHVTRSAHDATTFATEELTRESAGPGGPGTGGQTAPLHTPRPLTGRETDP